MATANLDEIYSDGAISKLSKTDKEKFKKHSIKEPFPVWLAIVLHLITLGIFSWIYYPMKHGDFAKIKEDDPSAAKAVLFQLIPFFNLYWIFFMYLRLTDRINLQYALRGKPKKVDRGLVLATCIVSVIPYINFIGFLIMWPIVYGFMQSALNELAKMK